MMRHLKQSFRFVLAAFFPLIAAANAADLPFHKQQFDCLIEPYRTIKLSSPVDGVIAEINVERGDYVVKGQVLGKLEDKVEQASLMLARAKATNVYSTSALAARLKQMRLKLSRAQQLADKKFVSEAMHDEALADAKVIEEQLKEAELNLKVAKLEVELADAVAKRRILRSPFDGVVTDVLLHPGEYRNEQSPILALAQIDPLVVEVYMPTAQYGRVTPTSGARVFLQKPTGSSHPAKVAVIDSVIDAASGTFTVRLELPNPGRVIPAGLSCKVQFSPT